MQLGSGNGGIYFAIPLTLTFPLPHSRFRHDALVFVVRCPILKKSFVSIPTTTSLSTQLLMHVLLFRTHHLRYQDGNSYMNIYILAMLYDGVVRYGRKGDGLVQNTQ